MSIRILLNNNATEYMKFDVLFFVLIMELFTKYHVHTHFKQIVLLNRNIHILDVACTLMIPMYVLKYLQYDFLSAYHLINTM